MALRFGSAVVLFIIIAYWGDEISAHALPLNIDIMAKSQDLSSRLVLSKKDSQWFNEKDVLVVGVMRTYDPPYDLVVGGLSYKGITADYLGLVASLLNVHIEVRYFSSMALMREALSSGEIDMFPSYDGATAIEEGYVASKNYVSDHPVLVVSSKISVFPTSDLEGVRLAVVAGYLPEEYLNKVRAKSKVQVYPTALAAVSAVAFAQADVFLGDFLRSDYLVRNNFRADLKLLDCIPIELRGQFFVVRQDGSLLRGVNAALQSISDYQSKSIVRHWVPESYDTVKKGRIELSNFEHSWVAEHPIVKVAARGGMPPFSYFDEKGRFSGLAASVLESITSRTGLKFQVVSAGSADKERELIDSGAVDLLAMAIPDANEGYRLRFTRPYSDYSVSPYVLVGRKSKFIEANMDQLGEKNLEGCKKAAGYKLRGRLFAYSSDGNYTEFSDTETLFSAVAAGISHAAIVPLKVASHMINHGYGESLQVFCSVEEGPENITLATGQGAIELYSILDKALGAISSSELEEMQSSVVRDVSAFRPEETREWSQLQIVLLSLGLAFVLGVAIFLTHQVRARKVAQKILKAELSFIRALIDGAPHPIYVLDRTCRLLMCNGRYLEELQIESESVVGKPIDENPYSDIIHTQAHMHKYPQQMHDGTSMFGDRQVTWRDGRILTIYEWAMPFHNTGGKVAGLIGGWIDVSERQHLLDQLQQAKQLAEDANQAKTVFLANMSHEIRTPMNAVIGMLELAMEKAEQGIIDRFAMDVASGAAHGMMELIGDILDIARIESNRLSLAPERANLRELVESVVRIFDAQARQKRLQLLLDIESDVNCDVLVDPLRFKQILSNLLSNAIKFTDKGEVRLSLVVMSEVKNERIMINLEVQDTGIGISSEDQKYLFNPFSRAKNNQESIRSGAGLGLMISRTLCELMNGNLSLHSELGKGTTMRVQLNLASLPALPFDERMSHTTALQSHSLKILVVDDYPANRQLLSRQLSYLGHSVEDAPDGAHGLRVWRNGTFDVLITDCNMPTMDGYELTRAIRDLEAASGKVGCTIFGFTANALLDERTRCIDAGMNDCLFKPISLHDLAMRLGALSPLSMMPLTESQPATRVGSVTLHELEKLTRGDTELLRGLIEDLDHSNGEDLERLQILADKHDLHGLSNLAHRVKGGARIIRHTHLIECCEDLEAACMSIDTMRQNIAVKNLQAAMSELAAALVEQKSYKGW